VGTGGSPHDKVDQKLVSAVDTVEVPDGDDVAPRINTRERCADSFRNMTHCSKVPSIGGKTSRG
jgi:hypothetical protein